MIDFIIGVDNTSSIEVDVPIEGFLVGLEVVDVPMEPCLPDGEPVLEVPVVVPTKDRDLIVHKGQGCFKALLAVYQDVPRLWVLTPKVPRVPGRAVSMYINPSRPTTKAELYVPNLLFLSPHVGSLERRIDVQPVFENRSDNVPGEVPPVDVHLITCSSSKFGNIFEFHVFASGTSLMSTSVQ